MVWIIWAIWDKRHIQSTYSLLIYMITYLFIYFRSNHVYKFISRMWKRYYPHIQTFWRRFISTLLFIYFTSIFLFKFIIIYLFVSLIFGCGDLCFVTDWWKPFQRCNFWWNKLFAVASSERKRDKKIRQVCNGFELKVCMKCLKHV